MCLVTKVKVHGVEHTTFALATKGPGQLSKKQRKRLDWGPEVKGVPLLLVCSASTSLIAIKPRMYRSRRPHVKVKGMFTITPKFVDQNQATELWRSGYHVVDGHNRQRTGTVAFHDVWRTNTYENRDAGETYGIMHVNAQNSW